MHTHLHKYDTCDQSGMGIHSQRKGQVCIECGWSWVKYNIPPQLHELNKFNWIDLMLD